jgi:hypothetical protein
MSGCVTRQRTRGARKGGGRAPSRVGVAVTTSGNNVHVVHDLRHACCLKAAVQTAVVGKVVRITETLSGSPCRCMCGSTLRTTVRLRPGDFRLELWLGGKKVHEAPVAIRSVRGP